MEKENLAGKRSRGFGVVSSMEEKGGEIRCRKILIGNRQESRGRVIRWGRIVKITRSQPKKMLDQQYNSSWRLLNIHGI